MEVISSSSAWLSNYEVFRHLQDSKTTRGNGVKLPENILTVEFEAIEYFVKVGDNSTQTPEGISKILEFLQPIKLTKAEKLQIINLMPRTMVDFYLIVEECDERFREEEVEAILNKINENFPCVQNQESSTDDMKE